MPVSADLTTKLNQKFLFLDRITNMIMKAKLRTTASLDNISRRLNWRENVYKPRFFFINKQHQSIEPHKQSNKQSSNPSHKPHAHLITEPFNQISKMKAFLFGLLALVASASAHPGRDHAAPPSPPANPCGLVGPCPKVGEMECCGTGFVTCTNSGWVFLTVARGLPVFNCHLQARFSVAIP